MAEEEQKFLDAWMQNAASSGEMPEEESAILEAWRAEADEGQKVEAKIDAHDDGGKGQGQEISVDISDEDLAIVVSVLEKLSSNQELYKSSRLRSVRTALMPLYEIQKGGMYGGQTKDKFKLKARKKFNQTHQKNQQKQEDQEFIRKTTLRAGRMKRLEQLVQQQGLASGPANNVDGLMLEEGETKGELALQNIDDKDKDKGKEGIREEEVAESAEEAAEIQQQLQLQQQLNLQKQIESQFMFVLDGVATDEDGLDVGMEDEDATTEEVGAGTKEGERERQGEKQKQKQLHEAKQCYTCKRRYRELHHFYDKLCPSCAGLNWAKRQQKVDLMGRVVLVTGGRVKIGFQACLKLLRCGATVIITSRFPADTAKRYAQQKDYSQWGSKVHVYGLDLRDLVAVEMFCTHVLQTYSRLDGIINNACQTVRRPTAYYQHLLTYERGFEEAEARGSGGQLLLQDGAASSKEGTSVGEKDDVRCMLEQHLLLQSKSIESMESMGSFKEKSLSGPGIGPGMLQSSSSYEASQIPLLPEDTARVSAVREREGEGEGDTEIQRKREMEEGAVVLPKGVYDINNQQVDVRTRNSWCLRMHEVSTPEVVGTWIIGEVDAYPLPDRKRI